MGLLVDRMIRAAKCDVQFYENIEADASAIGQAMGIVVLSSVANGVGMFQIGGIKGLVMGMIGSFVGWLFWSYLTYMIGTKLLPEPQTRTTYHEVLRTVGFASTPGIIRVLAIIPTWASIVLAVANVWMLVAMVIAVRQALDYHSTFRAFGISLIGWVLQGVIIVAVLGVLET